MSEQAELVALVRDHLKISEQVMAELVELKKKGIEVTEQLIRMEGRIELTIQHAAMENLALKATIDSEHISRYVEKAELAGLVHRLETQRTRDVTTLKLLWSAVAGIAALMLWLYDKGVIHVG